MSAAAAASAPLLSTQWFRVAALKPRIDRQARIERQVVRSQVWHVIARTDGSATFRLNAAAWSAVARCNGARSVQQAWDQALAEQGDAAPTQDEFIDMLARLHGAGLLSFDRKPDFGAQRAAALPATGAESEASAHGASSLLAWRVPLGDPDAWLARCAPHLRLLFTPAALLLWALAVVLAAFAAWTHAGEIAAQWQAVHASPRLLWTAWLAYPVIKALHEIAHGLAARHWGARVPQWGVTLLMFVPTPYVDASAASALPRARQRISVAAAGIVVDLAIAALALALLLALQPGAWRDTALVVFFIAGLSSLLVNANPLLRFDGYHMLCDALGLPNLAARSHTHWMQQLRLRVLRLPGEATLVAAPGERAWLWAYAPAALAMRWTIALAAVWWLASVSFWLGVLVAALLAWQLVARPALALLRWLDTLSAAPALRTRALRRGSALAAALLVPLALLPVPDATVAQGVMWLPESALLRAGTDGFIDEVLVSDGQTVAAGDAVLRLAAPALLAERERLLGRIDALLSQQLAVLRDDPAEAVRAEHELRSAQAELERSEQRIEQLTLRAQVAGRVAIARAQDLPGRHVERGALLAHVLTGEPGLVRVAITHERAGLVADRAGTVEVRRSDASAAPLRGTWLGQASGGGALLPSAALGERSGGRIAVDAQDEKGLRPAQAVIVADVRLAADAPALERIGERALVRFEHGMAPLAWQAARALQQQVLRHFNPGR